MLNELKQTLKDYLFLNYVESKKDAEETPFESKYKARELVKSQIEKIITIDSSLLTDDNEYMKSLETKHLNETYEYFMNLLEPECLSKYSMNSKKFLILKLFEYNLAKNYAETEEIESGEKLFARLVQQLDTLTLNKNMEQIYNPLIFNLKLNCFMELIIIWSFRSDYKKCLKLLLQIDEAYEIFKQDSNRNYLENNSQDAAAAAEFKTMPFDPTELISIDLKLNDEIRKNNFESIYTHCLFYSAQVYAKLDEKDKSAYYCQLTLQRQIDQNKMILNNDEDTNTNKNDLTILNQQLQEKVSFQPLDWATHAAALSQYYVCQNDFATARHCLASADSILNKLNSTTTTDDEKLNEQTHSIRRCWAKYAIELLKIAKTKLLESTDQPDQKSLLELIDKPSQFHFNLPAIYDYDECIKNSISSNMPLDYEQARQVFLKAVCILNTAREYFKLDGYVTDHCEITRDLSELYSCLIFFESDLDRRCKMHKRRLDLLLPICDEISEQFYLTIKRQLLFDIGSIYSEMMDAKLEIFKEKKDKSILTPVESKQSVQKINQLALKGISTFELFLDTMKVMPKKEVLPDKFDDHNVRPALLAKFYLGRFYSKLITLDAGKRLENMKLTLDSYSYLVNYCDKHKNDNSKETIDAMLNEYTVCQGIIFFFIKINFLNLFLFLKIEMITFLPAQMDKLRLQI